jgi:site-specific DNA recombinase
MQRLLEENEPYTVAASEDTQQQVPYELIKSILENFSMILSKSDSREEKKLLLHMIIYEITINRLREIDSIKLKINDNLIEYISKQDGVPIKNTLSIFALRGIGVGSINHKKEWVIKEILS